MPDSSGLFTMGPTVSALVSTILATQAANLKGYWQCNEPNGTTLADSSGNGNTMSISGTINTNYWLGEAGADGTCFRTDGSVGRATIGTGVVGGTATTWTFWFLVKGAAADFGGGAAVCQSNTGTNDQRIQNGNHGTTINAEAYAQGLAGSSTNPFGGSSYDGAWHSQTWRRNGTAFSLFVDNVVAATDTVSINTCTFNQTSIMALQILAGTFYAKGSIQHVAAWDTNLSDAELTAIAATVP